MQWVNLWLLLCDLCANNQHWTHSKKRFLLGELFSKIQNRANEQTLLLKHFSKCSAENPGHLSHSTGPEERPAARLLKGNVAAAFSPLHRALQFKKHLFFTAQPVWPSPDFYHMWKSGEAGWRSTRLKVDLWVHTNNKRLSRKVQDHRWSFSFKQLQCGSGGV